MVDKKKISTPDILYNIGIKAGILLIIVKIIQLIIALNK